MDSVAEINTRIAGRYVVFFDGVCNLCNGFVNFLIDRDSKNRFMFSSLHSGESRALLPADITEAMDSVVVLTPEGHIYRESDAILEIARHMNGLYPALSVFRVLPRGLRDGIYRWVARNRYRWFGKQDVCRVPTPELTSRFV